MPEITVGAQLVPARLLEVRQVLENLSAEDIGDLDPALGDWARRPLGREALAGAVLPALGSIFVCLMNTEPAGLMVIERRRLGGQVRLMAVATDMRRKGIARSMLTLSLEQAALGSLGWLWMSVPGGNQIATRTALACGFRRWQPQFLSRPPRAALLAVAGPVHAQPAANLKLLADWARTEIEAGDAWAAELLETELLPLVLPEGGTALTLHADGRVIGMAHVRDTSGRVGVTLWLEHARWGTPSELHALRAALNVLGRPPQQIDVHYGSEGHLRAAYPILKGHAFQPAIKPRVLMLRRLT